MVAGRIEERTETHLGLGRSHYNRVPWTAVPAGSLFQMELCRTIPLSRTSVEAKRNERRVDRPPLGAYLPGIALIGSLERRGRDHGKRLPRAASARAALALAIV